MKHFLYPDQYRSKLKDQKKLLDPQIEKLVAMFEQSEYHQARQQFKQQLIDSKKLQDTAACRQVFQGVCNAFRINPQYETLKKPHKLGLFDPDKNLVYLCIPDDLHQKFTSKERFALGVINILVHECTHAWIHSLPSDDPDETICRVLRDYKEPNISPELSIAINGTHWLYLDQPNELAAVYVANKFVERLFPEHPPGEFHA